MKKNFLLLWLIVFLLLGAVGCNNAKKMDTIAEEVSVAISSIDADERFNAMAYINVNNDSIIITLENNIGNSLRSIDIETKQYNKKDEVVHVTNKRAEYLLDGQQYICGEIINTDDKVVKVDIKISVDENADDQEIGMLYNNSINKIIKFEENTNSFRCTIENNANVDIIDFEAVLVYYKGQKPIFISPIEDKKIDVETTIVRHDSIPLVVSREDGLSDLDFDDVKIIINRARGTN